MGDPQKSKNRREIPIDIISNILLRLPTKDFVRSFCVCKLWRVIVADPSLRKLHVAHHALAAASSEPKVLLVTETGEAGRSDDASFFNLSSAKALSQVAIPCGYRLSGVCNDLLCFALDQDQAPAIVCNPVTGETLQLPKAPPLPAGDRLSHIFVLGFSAPTKQYKMFRISFPTWHGSRDETNYIAVYTLGGGGDGWDQCSSFSRFHPLKSPAPVHIDGNIFVPTANLADKRAKAARMLVLDVATETPLLYRIPYNYNDYHEAWDDMMADSFDLNGQMCFAVVSFYSNITTSVKIKLWIIKPPGELDGKDDDDKLYWDLRYSFYFDDPFYLNVPRGAWIDHTQTLCYRLGNSLCKYDTRGHSPSSNGVVDSLSFDERLDLPEAPRARPGCPSCSYRLEFCQWSIYGVYRPSMLSPLVFALPPSQDKKGKKQPHFENTLTRALMVMDLDEHMDEDDICDNT